MTMIKKRKVVRRRQDNSGASPEEKEKARKSRMYFNENTQAAIIKFQQSNDPQERNRIYLKEIHPAFDKLVENLINVYKFTSVHESQEDLKADCVSFLFETLGKWKSDRGTAAFAYFNVCAKNSLIIRTKQKAQKMKRNVSFDDPESLTQSDIRTIDDKQKVQSQEVFLNERTSIQELIENLYEIRADANTENELLCINSVIEIFERVYDIDILNRTAIMLYLRELSGLSPKQLSTTMQSIRKQYKLLKTLLEDSDEY